jgi:alpha-1,6-mannosyltransferase
MRAFGSKRTLALQTSFLRVGVNLLGAVALAAYAVLTVLSYVQVPVLWRNHGSTPHAVAFFDDLATKFPLVGLSRLFETNAAIIITYHVPVGIITAVWIALVTILHRREHALDANLDALLMRWSVAFAVVCVLAFPLFTQDFWLSMAWGRMAAEGTNPYHNLFTDETLTGLPLDHFPMVMSYGPGWAILSAVVMALTGKSVLAATILFKGVLLAAWLASLALIRTMTAAKPPLDRCLALVVAGWMPLGVLQTVAEGHNDIFMVWLALMWLALLGQGRWLAPIALTGSVLGKYVTAPLFLVDLIVAWRLHGLAWRQLFVRYVGPGLLGLAVFGIFYRSPDFFDGTRRISEWEFLQPRHAVEAIELGLGISLNPLDHLITAGFALFALYGLVVLWRSATLDNAVKAALGIMSAISFVGIAHLWPWYLVWTVLLAALVPRWWLARFVIGVSLLGAFSLSIWWVEPFENSREWASLALYLGAILWCVLTRPSTLAGSSARRPEDIAGGSFERS